MTIAEDLEWLGTTTADGSEQLERVRAHIATLEQGRSDWFTRRAWSSLKEWLERDEVRFVVATVDNGKWTIEAVQPRVPIEECEAAPGIDVPSHEVLYTETRFEIETVPCPSLLGLWCASKL